MLTEFVTVIYSVGNSDEDDNLYLEMIAIYKDRTNAIITTQNKHPDCDIYQCTCEEFKNMFSGINITLLRKPFNTFLATFEILK